MRHRQNRQRRTGPHAVPRSWVLPNRLGTSVPAVGAQEFAPFGQPLPAALGLNADQARHCRKGETK